MINCVTKLFTNYYEKSAKTGYFFSLAAILQSSARKRLKFSRFFVQRPYRKCDLGGSLTDGKVIDSSIDNAIVEETEFHLLVGEVNETNVVSPR